MFYSRRMKDLVIIIIIIIIIIINIIIHCKVLPRDTTLERQLMRDTLGVKQCTSACFPISLPNTFVQS